MPDRNDKTDAGEKNDPSGVDSGSSEGLDADSRSSEGRDGDSSSSEGLDADSSSTGSFDPARYWEDRLRADYSLQGVGYIGLGRPYNRWLYRLRTRIFRRIAATLDRDTPLSGLKVLDVGSGTGFYLERWLEAGAAELVGSDLTEVAVANLRTRFPNLDIRRLDITAESLPFEPGSFDAVSAFDVLFHIVDDARYRRAFANAARLLKPGGWFLFSENLVHGPSLRAPHVVSRSAEEVGAALHAAGLTEIRRGAMFVLMNYPVDTRSRLPGKVWSLATLPIRAGGRFGAGLGGIAGALVYPLELFLTSRLGEGPSTEFVIARKP